MTQAGAPAGDARRARSPLRLRAEDAEDLAVISACLQDALVAVRDLAYDPGARVLHAGRQPLPLGGLRSRRQQDGGRSSARCCAVTFDDITAAAYRGFHRGEKDRILWLLAIRLAQDAADAPAGSRRSSSTSPETPGSGSAPRRCVFAPGISATPGRRRGSPATGRWPSRMAVELRNRRVDEAGRDR